MERGVSLARVIASISMTDKLFSNRYVKETIIPSTQCTTTASQIKRTARSLTSAKSSATIKTALSWLINIHIIVYAVLTHH